MAGFATYQIQITDVDGTDYTDTAVSIGSEITAKDFFVVDTPNTYKTPLPVGKAFNNVPLSDYVTVLDSVSGYSVFSGGLYSYYGGHYGYIEVKNESGDVLAYYEGTSSYDVLSDDSISFEFDNVGTYTITYRAYIYNSSYGGSYVYITYTFLVIENQNPLKKWTITDVINRVLMLAEPLRKGESPRFYLNTKQAGLFDNILAPQFSFTKQTLRECLQEIGGVIHGEPRIKINGDSGEYLYEVSFDMYGGKTYWQYAHLAYIKKTYTQQIENYCSYIDTAAENLVNALGAAVNASGDLVDGGTICEPYSGGFKTVRCDTLYERITEDNMIIPTVLPIYSIIKVECAYNGDFENYVDITAYVFESSLYNTQLSSYQSAYPYSKAYGLKYTQGEKNIECLNFKQENAFSSIFEKYAIVNILKSVTGESISIDEYPLLAFRVTYVPFYSARVGQTKPYFTEFPRGAGLVYNQQSNVVESRYYGENLKGAVARLGNTDISLTYLLSSMSQVPTPGMLFDDDYYIATVECEYLPTMIKCQIGLSKDFNRLSQYIGISSEKRYSEVSQTQAVERDVLYKEYVEIGYYDTCSDGGDTDSLIGESFFYALAAEFAGGSSSYAKQITNVVAWGETAQSGTLNVVQLPVIASAFGNSISYGWAYEDNYSAGAKADDQGTYTGTNSGNSVTGYFENNTRYCDYYGRLYYYHFDLQPYGTAATEDIAKALPEYDSSTPPTKTSGYVSTEPANSAYDSQPFIMRKDNREQIQVNFQIDFVTQDKDLIIGSALAANHPTVRGTSTGAKLYIFPERLNKFIREVNGSYTLETDFNTLDGYDLYINVNSNRNRLYSTEINIGSYSGGKFAESGKAWAIVTNQTTITETVETEDGITTEQSYTYGGEVLLAKNMDFTTGDTFPTIYITKRRDVFDKSVWKDHI